MTEYEPSHEIADVLNETFPSPNEAPLNGTTIIWDYGRGELMPFTSEVLSCQVEESSATPIPTVYFSEPSTSIDDHSVLYEEITRARCIDCDKIVDISQPTETKKHLCELFRRLSCDQCGMRFNYQQNIQVHRIAAHIRQDEFVPGTGCALCENKNKKKFQRFSAFIAHLKTHTRNDNYSCSACGVEFEYSNLFNRHRRIEHGIGELTKSALACSELGYCRQCDLLMEQSKVEVHKVAHTAHSKLEKSAKAKERGMEQQKKNSKAHSRKYTCDKCSKAFVRPAELKRHMGVHNKTTTNTCAICEKNFAHQSGLRSHRKIAHGTVKTISCPLCGLSFNKKSNCDRHVKEIHPLNSKKPMTECHLCPSQFKNIGALNKHLLRVHNAEKVVPQSTQIEPILATTVEQLSKISSQKGSKYPHKCNKCDKSFKHRSSLKVHQDIHSRKEIDDPLLTDPKCHICLKHLSSKNNLRRHLLTHQNQYECPDCCQKFHSIHRLDKHKCYRAVTNQNGSYQQDIFVNPSTIRTGLAPPKSYFCKQCPSSFYSFKAFKEHKSLHLGLKPYLCWTCHKSFRTSDLLALHKEIHNREPVYCEYCPHVLNGRLQYAAHLRTVHQQNRLPSSATLLINRDVGISSTQSEYFADRGEPMEGFRTRAQSADLEPREMGENSWIPMGNSETVADRSLRCPFCLLEFASVAHITQHFSNTQNESAHLFIMVPCPLCDVSMQGSVAAFQHFSSIHTYVFHDTQSAQLAVYGPMESSECMSNSFPNNSKKHKCTVCGTAFHKPSDVVRHMRTHTGERPYQCEICHSTFSLQSTLNSHIQTHSQGDPEYECSICHNKFFKKNALTLHLRTHTGEKPLKCHYCATTFRTSALRRCHEKLTHLVGAKSSVTNRPRTESLRHQSQPVTYERQIQPVPQKGFVYPVAIQQQYPIQQLKRITTRRVIDTLAQISRVDPAPLNTAHDSAFSKTVYPLEVERIHITARRISITEYSVTVARKPPTAIREGIDTTASIALTTLKNFADQEIPMRLTLMDNQQLNVMAKGVLTALEDTPQVVLRAHPYNPAVRSSVELLPPHHIDFINRCDVCDVDLPTKEISDAHFASEDHETAQVLHPLADVVQDTIDDSLLITQAIPHHRTEDFICKLCGRKFLDTDPLVAHIRLEHERDHPHTLAPRPLARTAPPLEATRHQLTF